MLLGRSHTKEILKKNKIEYYKKIKSQSYNEKLIEQSSACKILLPSTSHLSRIEKWCFLKTVSSLTPYSGTRNSTHAAFDRPEACKHIGWFWPTDSPPQDLISSQKPPHSNSVAQQPTQWGTVSNPYNEIENESYSEDRH